MNRHILNTEIQDFINANLNADVTSVLLKKSKFEKVSLAEIAEQLDAKQRCRKKLPSWYAAEGIYYPNKLHIEQASSETTAKYKADLVSGKSLIDLTGGFGVDSYYFGKKFETVIHCEIDEKLSAIVKSNYEMLDAHNIEVVHADGLQYLAKTEAQYDCIYMDPSRRHDVKGKVYYLKDCLPNVPEHLDMLMKQSNQLLIKASPMLDISQGISELKFVKAVHCVAVNNEVRELLFLIENGYESDIYIKAVNMAKTSQSDFSFFRMEEQHAQPDYAEVQEYMYEPNAAILKSGGFKILSERLKLHKLHKHTHLYTSPNLIEFPGRRFKVDGVFPYNKAILKKRIYKMKCNVSVRNFPESVAEIKKRWKLKDGGENYLFFTTNSKDEKIVIISRKK